MSILVEPTPLDTKLTRLAEAVREAVEFEVHVGVAVLGERGLQDFDAEAADVAVAAFGFSSRSRPWRELSRAEAEGFIAFSMGHDLAYPNPPVRDDNRCRLLTTDLLAAVEGALRVFTLHNKKRPEQTASYSYFPLREDWTFSEAYLLVGKMGVVLALFLAED